MTSVTQMQKHKDRLAHLKLMLKTRKDPKTGEYLPGTEKEVELVREEIAELVPIIGNA